MGVKISPHVIQSPSRNLVVVAIPRSPHLPVPVGAVREPPVPTHPPPVVLAHAGTHPHPPPVVPAHAGTHSHPPPVVPAHAGTHSHPPPVVPAHAGTHSHPPPVVTAHAGTHPHPPPVVLAQSLAPVKNPSFILSTPQCHYYENSLLRAYKSLPP